MTKKAAQVSLELKAALQRSKYSNSVKFHNWLQSRGLSCNYPYFRKIFLGEITPSARITQEIAQCLGAEGENIVIAWCMDSMPDHKHLFEAQLKMKVPADKKQNFQKIPKSGKKNNSTLNDYQLSVIAKSERHYLFFLLTVMARNPMTVSELSHQIQGVRGTNKLESIIDDFVVASLVVLSDGTHVHSKSSDVLFPDRSQTLEAYFEKLDKWDADLPQIVNMKLLNRRVLLRRVSTSSLDLINQHLELICALVKMSDDSDPQKNNSVLRLAFEFSEGKWPG